MPDRIRRAAIITPFFVDRDAVCNDVFHGARVLRGQGWDARVFAVSGQSEREPALPIADLAAFAASPEDLAVFHFSTGRRDVQEAVAALKCRRILKFHNITPPELFSMWSDELAEATRAGRREMPAVARLGWEQAWADSAYNLQEILPSLAAGTPTLVLPPFHETDGLLALRPADSPRAGVPRLLTVGRVVQNKGHPFLLRVLHYLVHELETPAHLDIVGKPDHRLLAYQRVLELMVREFGLESRVTFHGEVPAADLARRYGEATVFVSTSEHEGFCVPIVEAMAFGVPVVALGTTAVPETVGEAGIVWEERDPRRYALAIQRLLRQPEERQWLGTLGRRRYEERFANAILESRMLEAIAVTARSPG